MKKSLAAALLLAGFLTSGCATKLTAKAIYPGDEKKADEINQVTTAWRDEAGNVTLCVYGLPAGANAWLAEGRSYSLVYPAATSPQLEIVHHETIPRYRVTAADVRDACAPTMNSMTEIPVQSINADEFGDTDYCRISDNALATYFENRVEAPAIYMFDYSFGTEMSRSYRMNVVYVHEAPIFKDARAVEIATDPRRIPSRPAYILALPFALALDLVSSPIQILAQLSLRSDQPMPAARPYPRGCPPAKYPGR